MCQGSLAAEQVMPCEAGGGVVVNRPSSALNCPRPRLVKSLGAGGLAFPRTIIHSSAAPLPPPHQLGVLGTQQAKVWVKRGDVHAERPEDVVAVPLERLGTAVAAFAARGIPWVALQDHIPGPIVKFYGVAYGRFFRWYGAEAGFAGERPPIDETALQAVGFYAAGRPRLEGFGGGRAVPGPGRPALRGCHPQARFAACRAAGAGP